MTDRLKNVLLVVASVAALALGGSALAGAVSGSSLQGGSSAAAIQTNAAPPAGRTGLPPQRADETLLSGDTASTVRAAALAKVPGGTIERVETDADGHAKYEAHMTNASGSRVTVYVDADFDVVSVESGP
jgi:uncharacterized membrane protein YkoI